MKEEKGYLEKLKEIAIKKETKTTSIQIFKQENMSPEVKKFLEEEIRKCNTIPEKVKLEITFKESSYRLSNYEYIDRNGEMKNRKTPMIITEIKYAPKASKLIMGVPFPLAISKNAIIGLINYINSKDKNHNLKNRTFTVKNINRHTYIWKEVV